MSRLTNEMANDMKIPAYSGESKQYYYGRLVYSGLAHWMRYITQDYTQDNHKSKIYLLNRGREILENMLQCIPEARAWFFEEYGDVDEVVKEIRSRMLNSGELFECNEKTRIALPTYQVQENGRIYGISNEKKDEHFIGITRIVDKCDFVDNIAEEKDINEYINWIYSCAIWTEFKESNQFEFFDDFSKRAPYQSWSNRCINKGKIHLARTTIMKGLYEYWLIKRDGERWFSAPLNENLAEYKEERRIILGLRLLYGNKMEARYMKTNNYVILRLFCRMPLLEEIILETYCWPSRYMSDKLEYIIPNELWKTISKILEVNLGICIKENM